MIHRINIEGIKLYAFHGCLEEESRIGGNYQVDVHLDIDFAEAAKKDDLKKTIDYCAVYEICKKEMAIRSKLIEHVCARIFANLKKSFPVVKRLRVRVTKFNPPMNGDVNKVSVVIQEDFLDRTLSGTVGI